MKRNTFYIYGLLLSIILIAQDGHIYLYDRDGYNETIPIDSIKSIIFSMNRTNTIRIQHKDGSQTESLITNLDMITFVSVPPSGSYEKPSQIVNTTFALRQNYPNPFNPSTTIEYELPESGRVLIQIFDVKGQLVRILESGNRFSGRHRVIWDGKNGDLQRVASGVYLYRMHYGNSVQMRKLLLLK
jgi:hypothetical protein